MRLYRCLAMLVIILALATSFFSCRVDGYDTDPRLNLTFSADSVLFDTVFTTLGSSTRALKVYNTHNRRINISSVSLGGGSQSFFRINVDGFSGSLVRDVEIEPNDSIFIFVEITVDPVNQNLPLVIADSILFNLNNNVQNVKLVAWGQDAHFIHPNYTNEYGISYHLIEEDAIWGNELPYVIYGLAVVAPGKTLQIREGARIHLHNNSSLIFLAQSSLRISGSLEAPVVIQGDRLEPFYREIPGQWGRIWLTATSKDHQIDYAIIKNGTVGIQIDSIGSTSNPTLRLRNTIIRNMSIAGLLAQGSHVEAENTVIANCGQHALILALGGNYDFRHCTFANYYNISFRQTPSLLLNNYYTDTLQQVHVRDFGRLSFANSIIYGSMPEELAFDFLPGTAPSFSFDHCLVKTSKNLPAPSFVEVIRNRSPEFAGIQAGDYRLKENSPAIGAANPQVALQIPVDILGHHRTVRADIGAYQYYEIEEK